MAAVLQDREHWDIFLGRVERMCTVVNTNCETRYEQLWGGGGSNVITVITIPQKFNDLILEKWPEH